VSLKNESIDVMRRFATDATILHTADDTIKGTVAHMKPPADSVQRAAQRVPPAWIMFPRYASGEPSTLRRFGKGRALMSLATNSFNYNIAGASGFHTLCAVVERSACLEFVYGDLEDAVRVFDRLASGTLEPDDISAAS
jgi:HprK-related kinase A